MLWRPLSLVQPNQSSESRGNHLTGSSIISLGAYPVNRGLAEELGARDYYGRGFGLDERAIGTDVTGYDPEGLWKKDPNHVREKLPPGHRFFPDCQRETNARTIQWLMTRRDVESWFITLTFKNYVPEDRAFQMVTRWLRSVGDAYKRTMQQKEVSGSKGLTWAIAQEWQKRDVIHFHIILSGVRLGLLSRMRQENRWQGMGGGFARVYDASAKAAPYLAKYTGKTYHNGAISWGGTSRWDPPPLSLTCCRA